MARLHAFLDRESRERLKQEQQFAALIMFIADGAQIAQICRAHPEARHADEAGGNNLARRLPSEPIFLQAAE